MRRKEQIVVVAVLIICCYSQNVNITRIERMINNAIDLATAFEYPKNAFQYEPANKTNNKEFGNYDFIIIGGGTTGSLLANRLSENERWKILLLEAGEFGNELTDIPGLQSATIPSSFNWGYKSIPQTTACLGMKEQKCTYNRGKGVGGTTLFNGLSNTRGSPVDFDKWAQLNPGWSYAEVLPYFKKSENFVKNDPDAVVEPESHGLGGELNVQFRKPRHSQATRWLEAHQEIGYETIDLNGKRSIGASLAQVYTKDGKRQDTGTAFVKPITNRKNLKISTKSYITKIVICNETKTAKGVKFVHEGQLYTARARKEVILSAGVIASPQILMLSGIGPAEHLKQVGVPVFEDLDVGSTLRDHQIFCGLAFETNFTRDERTLKEYIEEYLEGKGTLTVPASEKNGMGFYQTKFEQHPNYPDLHSIMFVEDGFAGYLEKRLFPDRTPSKDFHMCLAVLHAKSVGTVRLKSSNHFDYPLIDSNLLTDTNNVDLDTLYEGVKIVLNLMNTTAYRAINMTLAPPPLPACDDKVALSEDYWHCAFRQFTTAGYHPVGSCPMGPDPKQGAVVDTNCKVYGVKNLRVADASVFPFTLSGHPGAPCMMIAEKISDLIKKKYHDNQ